MLPDMSDTLEEWAQDITVKTITRTTVDFVPVVSEASRSVKAVVQVANPEKLNVNEVDWSLRYLQIHSVDNIAMGEHVTYNGTDYKVISPSNYQSYGFNEVVAEEVKGPVS